MTVSALGSATINLTVTGSAFTNAIGSLASIGASNSAAMDVGLGHGGGVIDDDNLNPATANTAAFGTINLVTASAARLIVVVQAPGQAAGGLLGAEIEEHLGGGLEEDVVAGENGGVGDVLHDHRFAEGLGRDEDDVARAGEEVVLQHRLDGDSSKKVRAL